jgi:hypothetical protein
MAYYDQISDTSSKTPYQARKLWELLMSNHKAIYDDMLLCEMLRSAGFSEANRVKFREGECVQILAETVDMFPTLSLVTEAKA